MRNQRQMVVRDHSLAKFRESFFLLMKIQASLSSWKYTAGCISAIILFWINPMVEFSKGSFIEIELTNNIFFNTIWMIILTVLSLAYLICLGFVIHYLRLQRQIFINERRV